MGMLNSHFSLVFHKIWSDVVYANIANTESIFISCNAISCRVILVINLKITHPPTIPNTPSSCKSVNFLLNFCQ